MLIEQVKTPGNESSVENIVRLTMTLDQFCNLKDCVTLAYQSASEESRMWLVTTMMRDDFDRLPNLKFHGDDCVG